MPDRITNSGRKSSIHFIAAMVLIASISGCASLNPRPAGAPSPPEARLKPAQAQRALEKTKGQVAAFYTDLGRVRERISSLQSRPYWGGFERILLQYPALTDPGRASEVTPPMRARLSQWSRESKIGWESVMRDYLALANRCAILDMRRVAARQMLISVQAEYMAVVMMEASAGRNRQAEKIFSLVNSLDKPGACLDAIGLDRLGLYGAAPPGRPR
ncbi:MAG: hypothetical protein P4L43_14220 [Syntrophobacteraceae bacterium]|nr:hypothetical protein [Syntrophobacteraceae bacterium]